MDTKRILEPEEREPQVFIYDPNTPEEKRIYKSNLGSFTYSEILKNDPSIAVFLPDNGRIEEVQVATEI